MTLLRVEGLTHRYGDLVAVDGVHLEVAAGDRHALIGPNGAGKTTLLNLIAGTLRPHAGRVWLDGRDVTRAGPARRARAGVGRTHQHPAVWPELSTMDNVLVAARRPWGRLRPTMDRQRCAELLSLVGLAAASSVPAGALSHGQRRQLEFAIALAGQPRLLLLDEPAAGLAPSEVDALGKTLADLPHTVGVLLIEHHLDLVYAFADTVTVLHGGRAVAAGTAREIRTSSAVAAVYAGAP